MIETERYPSICWGGEIGRFTPPNWCRRGEIGRHATLKMLWAKAHVGSTPAGGTNCAGRTGPQRKKLFFLQGKKILRSKEHAGPEANGFALGGQGPGIFEKKINSRHPALNIEGQGEVGRGKMLWAKAHVGSTPAPGI